MTYYLVSNDDIPWFLVPFQLYIAALGAAVFMFWQVLAWLCGGDLN